MTETVREYIISDLRVLYSVPTQLFNPRKTAVILIHSEKQGNFK
jgi:hypothetical protein